jgi:hypothetical protein
MYGVNNVCAAEGTERFQGPCVKVNISLCRKRVVFEICACETGCFGNYDLTGVISIFGLLLGVNTAAHNCLFRATTTIFRVDPDDGGCMCLQNIGNITHLYTV